MLKPTRAYAPHALCAISGQYLDGRLAYRLGGDTLTQTANANKSRLVACDAYHTYVTAEQAARLACVGKPNANGVDYQVIVNANLDIECKLNLICRNGNKLPAFYPMGNGAVSARYLNAKPLSRLFKRIEAGAGGAYDYMVVVIRETKTNKVIDTLTVNLSRRRDNGCFKRKGEASDKMMVSIDEATEFIKGYRNR